MVSYIYYVHYIWCCSICQYYKGPTMWQTHHFPNLKNIDNENPRLCLGTFEGPPKDDIQSHLQTWVVTYPCLAFMAIKGNSEKKSHKVGLSQFLLDAPPFRPPMLTSQGTLEEWVESSSYSYLDANPNIRLIKTKKLKYLDNCTHNLETRVEGSSSYSYLDANPNIRWLKPKSLSKWTIAPKTLKLEKS